MRKSELLKLIVKFLLFAAIFVAVDYLYGYVNRLFERKALEHSPYAMSTKFAMEKVDSDVVIIGASEAQHSYVCSIIEDSLNMSVYNCGLDGSRFYYQNAIVNGIIDRYSPKVILWSVDPSFLSTPSQKDNDNMSALKPYYRSNQFCKNAVLRKSKYERIKMASFGYTYNSRLLIFLFKSFASDYQYQNGYAPLYGTMEGLSLQNRDFQDDLDVESEQVFTNTLSSCKEKGVEIVFFLTPRYDQGEYAHISQFKSMHRIINDCGYILIEDLYHHKDLMRPELFKDNAHLNNDGAETFTKMVVARI